MLNNKFQLVLILIFKGCDNNRFFQIRINFRGIEKMFFNFYPFFFNSINYNGENTLIVFRNNADRAENADSYQFPDPDVFSHPSQRFRVGLNPDPDMFQPVAEELAKSIPRDSIHTGPQYINIWIEFI